MLPAPLSYLTATAAAATAAAKPPQPIFSYFFIFILRQLKKKSPLPYTPKNGALYIFSTLIEEEEEVRGRD